jgi:DNA-binding response OmpR family regulator
MDAQDAKILVVDDEPRNLDALEAMLEPVGCRCVRAQSADEALLALLRHEFAAMVLDIRMPAMSGIELARLIKQRRRTQDVPILFLTAHLVDDEDVLRGYGAGAVDYLSKPIKPDILRSKIAVFVEIHRKTIALAGLNAALESEIVERQKAQEALEQANQELELRVRERRRMEEALSSAMSAGAYAGEYRIVRSDGSIVWITESGRAIRADDGRVEEDGGRQPRRDRRARRRAGARAVADQRAAGTRDRRAAGASEGRVPGDAQP